MIENQEGSQVEQGVQTETSPASTTNSGQPASPTTGANSGAAEVPFHQRPEAKEYLERQERSLERKWGKKFEDYQKSFDQKLQEFQNNSNRQGQTLSDQDASQLRNLAKLMMADPETAKMLGLDKIGSLQDRIESMNSSSLEQAIEQETQTVIGDYAKKYGYEPKTLEQDIYDYISNDPYWSEQPQGKGVVTKAVRDFFADKQQELAERAANMKLVTDNQNKSKAGSQKPLGSGQATKELPKTMNEFLKMRFKEAHDKEGVSFGA